MKPLRHKAIAATPGQAPSSHLESARRTIALEAEMTGRLRERLDERFEQACELILACRGRVVVSGMGKSGHIAGKIASTLASTGTPAFFVHPGEASHGDLGMVTPEDLVLALSNSGETAEMLTILPVIKRMGVELIVFTGACDSTLGRAADVCLDASVEREACPFNLAPTASTTVMLALGDALAVAVYEARGFTREDFARSHPGGTLGRRLLLYVSDLMHTGARIPKVQSQAALTEALLEMTGKGLGMTAVTDAAGRLVGVYTDGDLRRTLERGVDLKTCRIHEVMTRKPRTVPADMLAAEAVALLREKSINGLFVVDEHGAIVGALNMHDMLRAGVV
jgi:arabinose-5-phosphate isomerase